MNRRIESMRGVVATMDPFLVYLIAVNVVAFLLFTIDYLIMAGNDYDWDTGLMDGRILSLFAVAGGAPGMLLALAVWARRVNKRNIAWWFTAIVCLVVWGMVCAWKWGLVSFDGFWDAVFHGFNRGVLHGLDVYLLVANVATFLAFGFDKLIAADDGIDPRRKGGLRLPELWLMGLSLLGGSVGGMVAMRLFRHKTRKWYFVAGPPLFVVLQTVLFLYLHAAGLY